jgi:hypothetical protein
MPLPSNPSEESQISWAKQKALELAEAGQLKEAIDSMVSDLNSDPDSDPNMMLFVTGRAIALRNNPNLDKKTVVDWINGFNG